MTTPNHDQTNDRRAWKTLFATSLSVLLVFINSTALTIALPQLSNDLSATTVQTSWVLLVYMLTTTTLILVFGRLADILGRRRLYIGGILVFTVATLGCGLVGDAGTLILLRLIQGIGAAAIITNTTALLTDVFPPRLLSSALGFNATVAAVGQVLGPLLGGVITEFVGWRWIFLGCIPLSVMGLVWSIRLIPRIAPAGPRERMDLVGSAFSIIGIGLLVLASSVGTQQGWLSLPVAGLIGGSAVAWILFVVVQRRRAHPLVDISLFDDRALTLIYVSTFFCAISNFAVVLLASLYLQGVQGLSAIEASVRILPAPIGTMLAALVAGRLTRSFDPKWLAFTGLSLVASGAALFAVTLSTTTPGFITGAALFLVGVGVGLFMTPNTTSLMSRVGAHRRGIANAIRATLQSAGYLFSTALALAVATGGLTAAQQLAAYGGTLYAMSAADVQAFVTGIQHALIVLLVLAIAGAVVSAFTPRRNPAAGGSGEVVVAEQ